MIRKIYIPPGGWKMELQGGGLGLESNWESGLERNRQTGGQLRIPGGGMPVGLPLPRLNLSPPALNVRLTRASVAQPSPAVPVPLAGLATCQRGVRAVPAP